MNLAPHGLNRLRLPSFSFMAALLVLSNGDKTLAQNAQNRATTPQQLAMLAEQDLHAQKFPEAVNAYRKLLALDPQNGSAHSNLGLAYYLERDYGDAAPEFEIALESKPDLWNIVALCGMSEAQLGQNQKAVDHLAEALGQVTDPALRIAVGRELFTLLMQRRELTRAAQVIAELRELDPRNPDILYAAHQVYSLLANDAFVSLSQVMPGSARIYELQGDEMVQVANIPSALTAYRGAIALDPHLSGVHFALGEALSASHFNEEQNQAESEYKLALDDNPQDEQALSRLGQIELRRANWPAAAADFRHALDLQPADPGANEGLGVVLMSTGSSEKAVTCLSRAVQADPYDDSAYYHLSLACRDAGDADCASHAMKQFQELKAKKEELRNIFLSIRQASSHSRSDESSRPAHEKSDTDSLPHQQE